MSDFSITSNEKGTYQVLFKNGQSYTIETEKSAKELENCIKANKFTLFNNESYYVEVEIDDAEISIDDCKGTPVLIDGNRNKVYGSSKNDRIVVQGNENYVYGNDGNDSVEVEGYSNYIYGGNGNDRLEELQKNGDKSYVNTKFGIITYDSNNWNNHFYGQNGDDFITITQNASEMTGGDGTNLMYVGKGASDSMIIPGPKEDDIYIKSGTTNVKIINQNESDHVRVLGDSEDIMFNWYDNGDVAINLKEKMEGGMMRGTGMSWPTSKKN